MSRRVVEALQLNGEGYAELSQEEYAELASHSLEDDSETEFGGKAERRRLEKALLWKLDLRMSILVLIYVLNYIDRNNASAARLRGFENDLHLKGHEFNTLLSILYVGYIMMQVPSNMLLNYIGKPSIYLPVCMILWGGLSVLTGFAESFIGALILRFLLGFVEAAFFPGALFLLSKWYKRDELGSRTAILFSGSLLSNGFGTLLASAILNGMEGVRGCAAWRWLFYIEGGLTIIVAFASIFILPDFPATSTWLSPIERRLAEKRMEEDVGIRDEDVTVPGGHTDGLIMALSDWKVWWLALALAFLINSYSFNAFFPTLTETLGYNDTVTLLLCSPPWFFATVCALVVSRHSDARGERFYHILVPTVIGMFGFSLASSTMNFVARYIALFFMTQMYSGFVVFLAWISNSIPRPAAKRAVALAFINAFSQLGNIMGSYVWLKDWGPTYRTSYTICIATSLLSLIMCYIFRAHLVGVNEEIEKDEAETGQEEKGFRYML